MNRLLILTTACVLAGSSHAFTQRAGQTAPANTITVPQIVEGLRSQRLQVRADMIEKLTRLAGDAPQFRAVLGNADIQAALLDLLRRENAAISNQAPTGIGQNETAEGFAEYYSKVFSFAHETLPLLTAAAQREWIGELLRGAFNPDSAFAADMAKYGDLAVDALVELTRTPQPRSIRTNAYAILAQMVSLSAFQNRAGGYPRPLSFENRQRALKSVGDALRDDDDLVGHEVIRSLRRVPSVETLDILKDLSRKSALEPKFSRRRDYPITLQEEATRAIADMESKLGQGRR